VPDSITPLFVPLRREWFNAFARGEKTEEWRRCGPRWNSKSCYPGRPVVLSLGYRGARLSGRIVSYDVRAATGSAAEIYGEGTLCAVIGIAITR